MEYGLAARLPPKQWAEALAFFSTRPESPSAELLSRQSPSAELAASVSGMHPPTDP